MKICPGGSTERSQLRWCEWLVGTVVGVPHVVSNVLEEINRSSVHFKCKPDKYDGCDRLCFNTERQEDLHCTLGDMVSLGGLALVEKYSGKIKSYKRIIISSRNFPESLLHFAK